MSFVMFIFTLTSAMIITPILCSFVLHVIVETVAIMNTPEFKKVAEKAFLEASFSVTFVDGHLEAGVELVENYQTIDEMNEDRVDGVCFGARTQMAIRRNTQIDLLKTIQHQVGVSSYASLMMGTSVPNMASCC